MEAESTESSSVGFYHWMEWFHANRQKLIIGAVAVAVVAAGASIYSWKKGQDEINANSDFFNLSVVNMSDKWPMASPDSLLNVAREYPETPAGSRAQLLAAAEFFTEGKYPQAEQEFSKFLAADDHGPLAPQAQMGVAASLEAEGKIPDAIQKYQNILSLYPGEASIVSPAKLTLARLYEEQNKPDQALMYYDDLTRVPNPYDPWSAEAGERKALLLAKHPELMKAAPSASSPVMGASPIGVSIPAQHPPTAPSGAPSGTPKLLEPPPSSSQPGK